MKSFVHYKTVLVWLLCLMLFIFSNVKLMESVKETSSSIPNQIMAFVAVLAGCLMLIQFKCLFRSGLSRLMICWTCWTFFSGLFVFGNGLIILQMFFWQAVFYATYLLLIDNPARIRIFTLSFSIIAVIAAVYTYLAREVSAMAQFLSDTGQNSDFSEAALNIVFYPLLTIPWILTIKKGLWRNLLLLIVLISIILSVKRSAFLAGAMIIFFYILFYNRYTVRKKRRRYQFIIPLLLIGAVFYITDRYMADTGKYIVDRMENIQEDQGSGRIRIYNQVLERLSKNRFDEWVVGHGHYAVIQKIPAHKSAHNDFLEVLFDYGLFGFAIYVCLHFLLIVRVWRLYKNASPYFLPYLSSYIIFFILSMVSHLIIYPTYIIYLGAFWGAMEALLVSDRYTGRRFSSVMAADETFRNR